MGADKVDSGEWSERLEVLGVEVISLVSLVVTFYTSCKIVVDLFEGMFVYPYLLHRLRPNPSSPWDTIPELPLETTINNPPLHRPKPRSSYFAALIFLPMVLDESLCHGLP